MPAAATVAMVSAVVLGGCSGETTEEAAQPTPDPTSGQVRLLDRAPELAWSYEAAGEGSLHVHAGRAFVDLDEDETGLLDDDGRVATRFSGTFADADADRVLLEVLGDGSDTWTLAGIDGSVRWSVDQVDSFEPFSPRLTSDGVLLVQGRQLSLLDLEDGSERWTVDLGPEPQVVVDEAASRVATVDRDGRVVVHDLVDATVLLDEKTRITGDKHSIGWATFAHDLVAFADDDEVMVWSLTTRERVHEATFAERPPPTDHGDGATSVSISWEAEDGVERPAHGAVLDELPGGQALLRSGDLLGEEPRRSVTHQVLDPEGNVTRLDWKKSFTPIGLFGEPGREYAYLDHQMDGLFVLREGALDAPEPVGLAGAAVDGGVYLSTDGDVVAYALGQDPPVWSVQVTDLTDEDGFGESFTVHPTPEGLYVASENAIHFLR